MTKLAKYFGPAAEWPRRGGRREFASPRAPNCFLSCPLSAQLARIDSAGGAALRRAARPGAAAWRAARHWQRRREVVPAARRLGRWTRAV